jgi:shikimate kinase
MTQNFTIEYNPAFDFSARGKRICLAGPMGSGKTTIGKRLAAELGESFVDLDSEIERIEGRKIPEIHGDKGWEYFRQVESAALEGILKASLYYVISLGGGVNSHNIDKYRNDNVRLLKQYALTACLLPSHDIDYSATVLGERLKGDTNRPLLAGGDPVKKMKEILTQRIEFYKANSDMIFYTDNKPIDLVARFVCSGIKGLL